MSGIMTAIWKQTWGEKARKSYSRERERVEGREEKKIGGAIGGRQEGGQSGDENGLGHLRLSPRQPKLTTFHSSQVIPPDFRVILPFSEPDFPSFPLRVYISCHWSPLIYLQRKLSSLNVDYKMDCTK